nr:MAG TPA: hypothetical protein [Caudoviricetes sp.]
MGDHSGGDARPGRGPSGLLRSCPCPHDGRRPPDDS